MEENATEKAVTFVRRKTNSLVFSLVFLSDVVSESEFAGVSADRRRRSHSGSRRQQTYSSRRHLSIQRLP